MRELRRELGWTVVFVSTSFVSLTLGDDFRVLRAKGTPQPAAEKKGEKENVSDEGGVFSPDAGEAFWRRIPRVCTWLRCNGEKGVKGPPSSHNNNTM